MKAIAIVAGKVKPKVMEVIGMKGQKVGEYLPTDVKEKPPYHILQERVVA
tara:strand:+ start:216 stop:365 length:150 start_codon:yes stop_codon:yes gene_type:complete